MSNRLQAASERRRLVCAGLRALMGLALVTSVDARAHDSLGVCVQHGVSATVGAKHIDLTWDLTFFEKWSARERAAMDSDGNGTITRSEQQAYLKRLAPQISKQVTLHLAGTEPPLALLYDPEVDLLSSNHVGPAHHRLRLVFFAATPPNLRAGDEIVVEDRLWPEAKALVTVQAEGRDGCTVTPTVSVDSAFAPPRVGEPLLVRFKCLKPPAAQPTPQNNEIGQRPPAPRRNVTQPNGGSAL